MFKYPKNEYSVYYYQNSQTQKVPVQEYILFLSKKERAKVKKYIDYLKENRALLPKQYAKHIKGKFWELRVDFYPNRHRIFYFVAIGKQIILIHAFLKKTQKTPRQELVRAINNFKDFKVNHSFIEYEGKK